MTKDTLHDRLADAAAASAAPVPQGAQVRRSAVRHRNRRRGFAGAVIAVAAVVTVFGVASGLPSTQSLAPIAPPTATPTPTLEPTPTTTVPPPPATLPPVETTTVAPTPPLTQAEAQAFVEAMRFEDEDRWTEDENIETFPVFVDTSPTPFLAHGCDPGLEEVSAALAMRTVTKSGAESGSSRQIALFDTPGSGAEAFADLRSYMRSCHGDGSSIVDMGDHKVEKSYVGGQLQLGDESFWVATKEVIVEHDDPDWVGKELWYSTAALLALDGNVVTVIDDPAISEEMRAEFVEEATAEWEALQLQYEEVRRR
jgi:hypothetical protein